jgi:predicted acylesterase/phospholipase RssA
MAYTHIAASAGGLFVAAHLGAFQYLADHQVAPQAYSGSSCGAAVSALMAVGFDPNAIHTLTKRRPLSMFDPVRVGWDLADHERWGLFWPAGRQHIRQLLRKKMRTQTDPTFRQLYEELGRSLSISAVAANCGSLVRFGTDPGTLDVKIHDAVNASCSIPFFNPPTRIRRRLYVDGAIAEYMPLGAFADVPDKRRVVGLMIAKPLARNDGETLDHYMSALGGGLVRRLNNESRVEWADERSVSVAPDDLGMGVLGAPNAAQSDVLFDKGYEAMERFHEAEVRSYETNNSGRPS